MTNFTASYLTEDQSKKTYRYLRLTMAVLILMLLASVLLESQRTEGSCWQTSVSAYYYTPVQGVFVAALVALGTCMFVLKGSTTGEDVLLNLGGVLAMVVAFVPTPNPGECRRLPVGLPFPLPERPTRAETDAWESAQSIAAANVENNILALLIAGFVGVLIVLAVLRFAKTENGIDELQHGLMRLKVPARTGLIGAVVLLGAGLAWFIADADDFREKAHERAALGLFACIILVVGLNWRSCRSKSQGKDLPTAEDPARYGRYAHLYGVIALAIGASLAIVVLLRIAAGFDHWILVAEGAVIFLFAVFWIAQTIEMWDVGPRPRTTPTP